MRYTIRTPNTTFSGERAGITFNNGIATTDDPAIAAFFRDTLGYAVKEEEDPKPKPKPKPAQTPDA